MQSLISYGPDSKASHAKEVVGTDVVIDLVNKTVEITQEWGEVQTIPIEQIGHVELEGDVQIRDYQSKKNYELMEGHSNDG